MHLMPSQNRWEKEPVVKKVSIYMCACKSCIMPTREQYFRSRPLEDYIVYGIECHMHNNLANPILRRMLVDYTDDQQLHY